MTQFTTYEFKIIIINIIILDYYFTMDSFSYDIFGNEVANTLAEKEF